MDIKSMFLTNLGSCETDRWPYSNSSKSLENLHCVWNADDYDGQGAVFSKIAFIMDKVNNDYDNIQRFDYVNAPCEVCPGMLRLNMREVT